jgi:hypothetical protein
MFTVLLAVSALVQVSAYPDDAAHAFAHWLGTWSLNVAKPGSGTPVPQRGSRITFKAADNDQFRLLIDGTEPDGRLSHEEATFTPDGRTYPIEGWYPDTTLSLTNRGRWIEWIIRLRGKIVDRAMIEMAPERQSFTFRSHYVEQAKPIDSVRVYERE